MVCLERRRRPVIVSTLAAMKHLVVLTLILTGLVVGCGPRYGGGSFGSYANSDGASSTVVATQRDQSGRLLFAIAWTATNGGGSTSSSDRNLLTQIHGRPVHPSLDRHAVYSLQADGSLLELSLTDEQISTLFQEMQRADFHTSHSELWQKAVAPKLVRVEAIDGS